MKLEEHIAIWNHTAVKIFDIRHVIMNQEGLAAYKLPACGFIYGVRGSASLVLDGTIHKAERFYLLHAAKGMRLDIETEEYFEYYILFYRSELMFSRWKELARLMERSNPFYIQYGFTPHDPLNLHSYLSAMEHAWTIGGKLEKLQIKGLFYQFIHELLLQLQADEGSIQKTNFIHYTIRYLNDYYQENITLSSLAEKMNYSMRHLSVSFKQQTGVSPIEYLIRIRISHACKLLVETDGSLREIAAQVGYPDVYYFSRIFKKQTGYSPARYQALERQNPSKDRPFIASGLCIGVKKSLRYTNHVNDNDYQYLYGGSTFMKRNSKSALLLSVLISLTLLVSACMSGGGTGGNATNTAPAVTANAQKDTKAVDEAKTRIISTEKGNVEVPIDPKRVVVLYLLGDIAALGVDPVGISEIYDGAAFKDKLDGADSLGPEYEVNPESVMALNPDLIIVATEFSYDKLKSIAPTVYVPYDKLSTEERLGMLGQVFGKEQEAKTLLDQFQAKVEVSKQQLQEAGILEKTVTIMEGGAKEMFVVESTHFARGSQVLYEYLGMKAPEAVQKKMNVSKTEAGESVSMEVLPEYVGDYIIRSSWEGMDDLSSNKVWTSMDAVKSDHVIEVNFGLFFYSDLFSLDKQLDVLTEKLLETAAKQ